MPERIQALRNVDDKPFLPFSPRKPDFFPVAQFRERC
jgi:hypothetical protein